VVGTGALTAVFFFRGRQVTLNLNEETRDAGRTPGLGAVLAMIAALGVVLLLLSSLLPTVNQIGKDPVNAIGFQAASCCGLASFACAWNTGRVALTSPATLVAPVLRPVSSALLLAFVAIYGIQSFDVVTNVMGIGGIVVGLVPLFLNLLRVARARSR